MIFDSCSCKQQMLVFFGDGAYQPSTYFRHWRRLHWVHHMKCGWNVHYVMSICAFVVLSQHFIFVWRGSTRHPWSLSHALLRNLRSEINLVAEILRCWHVCVCVNPTRCHAGKNFQIRVESKSRGWMHGLAVIHQRRHCLSMVIWQRDAFVTYLPFQFQFLQHFNLSNLATG